ncbi:hypothetical protein [Desulfovibrio sp. SGI.169]|uniref:hypothetical protein n=1 Tax=Desulfovibrio sp. SGI.169 TaxID=3420561 RepID=UPI003D03769A
MPRFVFRVSCSVAIFCLALCLGASLAPARAAGPGASASTAGETPGGRSLWRAGGNVAVESQAGTPASEWNRGAAHAPDPADPASGLEELIALPPLAPSTVGDRAEPAVVVGEMRPWLDSRALRQSLDEIGLLKAAGFTYQPELAVPDDVCPQPGDWDQAAALSGMVASDQACALFFGKAEDAARENRLLRRLSPATALPALTRKEKDILTREPTGPAGREIIVRRSEAQVRAMLRAASRSEADLRLLGAHLYGLFLERLYTASVMVLAAAESDTLEPLHQARAALGANQGKVVELLARRGLLGDARFAATRLEIVDSLSRLLAGGQGRPTLARIEEALGIVREERASFLTPCREASRP